MVDSRQKGARAEAAAKKILKDYTKLGWERTPGSGALNAKHKLKGDLYIPDCKNKFCIEVKHYKDDHLTSKLLTDKNPQFLEWWWQTERQAEQTDRLPLLLFKKDRGKWFVAFTLDAITHENIVPPNTTLNYKTITFHLPHADRIQIAKLEDWLMHEEIIWIL